jgi:diketogulonate reductase-like aldo/keto reductase
MISKKLGTMGVFIPEVRMGTWDYRRGPDLMRQGLEAGALFTDTAESYGTESIVGNAIDGMSEKVFLATKISPQNFRGKPSGAPLSLASNASGGLRAD